METAKLPRILWRAEGVVAINGTVGMMGLERGLPLMVLGSVARLPGN